MKGFGNMMKEAQKLQQQMMAMQEEVGKTATTAKEIAEQIRGEIQGFTELIQSINDKEKAELRLELEEQRRLEAACLQALVRVLDHVYALQVGALRSGQPNLIEQVSNFQDACREAARSIFRQQPLWGKIPQTGWSFITR